MHDFLHGRWETWIQVDLLFQLRAYAVQWELHILLRLVPDDPQVLQLLAQAAACVLAVAD